MEETPMPGSIPTLTDVPPPPPPPVDPPQTPESPVFLTKEERDAMREPPLTRRQKVMQFAAMCWVGAIYLLGTPIRMFRNRRKETQWERRWRRQKRKDRVANFMLAGLAIGVVAILIGGYISSYYNTEEYITVTVSKTERVSYGSGDSVSHKYLVYTDHGTFECTDSWLFMKFNSSDVYGNIQGGKRYRLHVVGWRSEFGSVYKNILDATPAP